MTTRQRAYIAVLGRQLGAMTYRDAVRLTTVHGGYPIMPISAERASEIIRRLRRMAAER